MGTLAGFGGFFWLCRGVDEVGRSQPHALAQGSFVVLLTPR